MTRDKAITRAQGLCNKTDNDLFVIYDPSYGETKSTSFFVANLEEVETFFHGSIVINQYTSII
jgi:hypothetical protein